MIGFPSAYNQNPFFEKFGLKPSPLFKRILDRMEEERLSRSDMTRQEAETLVKRLIRDRESIDDT